jgi:hypothetical protein
MHEKAHEDAAFLVPLVKEAMALQHLLTLAKLLWSEE